MLEITIVSLVAGTILLLGLTIINVAVSDEVTDEIKLHAQDIARSNAVQERESKMSLEEQIAEHNITLPN